MKDNDQKYNFVKEKKHFQTKNLKIITVSSLTIRIMICTWVNKIQQ